jgi:hypothetical protein
VHAKFSRSAKIDANAEHHATAKNENDGIAPPFPRLPAETSCEES